MRGSLSVRVADGYTHRILTSKTRDLRFRKTAPGGHHSASCRLLLPRDTFPDLGPADRLYIYDARNARTIWEGYTENPGVTDGSGGQEFDLTAMGGMVLASDESRKLIYLDRSYDSWAQDTLESIYMPPSAQGSKAADPTVSNTDVLMCQLRPGSPVTNGNRAACSYLGFVNSGMELGGFAYSYRAGKIDANYAVESYVGTLPTFNAITQGGTATTTAQTTAEFVIDDYPAGKDILGLRLRRAAGGATNIADENTYAVFYNMRVLGRRMDRYGTLLSGIAGMRQSGYVLASWVVEDMLGRFLSVTCDPATATIDSTTFGIDQLSYPDGAKASQVFDDLALYEPDFLWEILESGSNGKHRFNYRAWPTTPRYEISVRDGYNAPGGEVDLCNRIAVFWTDQFGRQTQTVVTATVPELGSRVRDAEPITLPQDRSSSDVATRIGQQVLASKNTPPKAATAVVKRPILDRLTGMTVMPWEIEPGYVVRVRETGDDLRLTEMEYVDQDCSATLTLGTPVRSVEQMIADLSRSRR